MREPALPLLLLLLLQLQLQLGHERLSRLRRFDALLVAAPDGLSSGGPF